MEIPPVTRESIQRPASEAEVARAKADNARERERIFQATGVRITDEPMSPFCEVAARRISAYRQVKESAHD